MLMAGRAGPGGDLVGGPCPAASAGIGVDGKTRTLRSVTSVGQRPAGVARLVARHAGYSSAVTAISAMFRAIGAASALSARDRVYGKEKVYGSIP
jgi:hypothetical protein